MDEGQATAAPAAKKKETVYIDVTMKQPNPDGTPRVVKFPESTKAKKEVLEDAQGKPIGVRFDFASGDSDTITLEDLVAWGLFERSAVHGISQKGGDSYAGDKDAADAYESYMEVRTQIASGKWTEGGVGGAGAGSSILLKALVEATGQTIEAVRTTLATLSQKEKLVLRGDPTLAPIIQRLEAEKVGGVNRADVAAKFGLKAA